MIDLELDHNFVGLYVELVWVKQFAFKETPVNYPSPPHPPKSSMNSPP